MRRGIERSLDQLVVGDLWFALLPWEVDVLDDAAFGNRGTGYADALQAVATPEMGVAHHPIEISSEDQPEVSVSAIRTRVYQRTGNHVVGGAVRVEPLVECRHYRFPAQGRI